MYKYKICLLILCLITGLLGNSCNQPVKVDSKKICNTDSFTLQNFIPITNLKHGKDIAIKLPFDYTDAINNGFIIPSIRQVAEGKFLFSFEIKNKGEKSNSFKYKIYYQNESYKFFEIENGTKTENLDASENFYGSWEDRSVEFKSTPLIPADGEFHLIIDSVRIVGNPRNEVRYFTNGINTRWKRNPRVGSYSFLLAVSSNENLSNGKIPKTISDIGSTKNGEFKNPYFFYLYGGGVKVKDLGFLKSDSSLKVYANPDLGAGVFVNPQNFKKELYSNYFTKNCGQDTAVYNIAAFEQFINYVDTSMRFDNIPVVRDVTGDDYTKTDYNWDRAFYNRNELISTLPGVAQYPCETVYSDPVSHKIVVHNPGTKEGIWRKESVGIRTRNGLTYGKYRIKCKMAPQLNKNNIWNGLTNAIWLLNQQYGGNWNYRRACKKKGYMATYWGGENDKRVPFTDYSEIDFEMIKTYPYCPSDLYPPVIKTPVWDQYNRAKWNVNSPEEIEQYNDKITVTCTNWDMACWDPVNFNTGCNEIEYQNSKFSCHRWTDTYRALSERKYELNNELFGGAYYYFEIDWRPDEIIWSIGLSPDKMRIVGYISEKYSAIPNNQMTMIITQEYHNTKWWPGSPFIQENIPFPSKDLVGEIYELVIE